MKNRLFLPVALLMAGLMLLGVDRLVLHGIYSWAASTPEYRAMVLELAAVYILLALSLCKIRSRKGKLAAVGGVSGVFFWCHAVFLPMAAAGLYLAYICGTGYLLRRGVFRLEVPEGEGYGADFLLGASGVIALFCLMSAAGIGAIGNLRFVVGISGMGLLLVLFRKRHRMQKKLTETAASCLGLFWGHGRELLLAFILLMFLLQAGRMNISVDHDTLWYSVRSEYMLDNGPKGIYENMGTVSLVYTYPKGWEVLTLPLCDLPSHSFLLAFNLWIAALVLYTACRIARQYMEARYVLLVPFLLAGIPGIMNMGISGKTDMITLFLQSLLILYMVHFIKDKKPSRLAVSLGALFLSWTMKPTAVVFSTVVFGMSVLLLLATGCGRLWTQRSEEAGCGWTQRSEEAGGGRLWTQRSKEAGCGRPWELRSEAEAGWTRPGRSAGWRQMLSVCLPTAALALIWYRTYRFVGVPVTSIFSGIFQKLGCEIRYPFLVWDIPDYGAKPTAMEAVRQLAERIYGVFILPGAEDMSRVLIAWCSLSVVFFCLLWLASLPGRDKDGKDAASQRPLLWYGRSLLLSLGLASLYSIYSLKQVDGNYFILFYTLTILYGCNVIAGLGRRAKELGRERRFKRQIGLLLLMLTLFDSLMVSLSNLAWSVGLTPISLSALGYWDHEEEARKAMEEKGNGQIWEILGADPENRAIAFGEHLSVLSFPCNVQSYTDISSSSGNEFLVEDVGAFTAYMEYARTEYVYVEAGYMAEEYAGYRLLWDCIQAGILTNIRSEYGNILADVDLEGEPGADAEKELEAFDRYYIVKEE